MNWTRVMQQQGWSIADSGASIDPFAVLSEGEPKARLSIGVKAGEYREIFVNVSIECPQTEAYINLAAECAFRKAVEIANDCASHVGIPGLPPFDDA